MTYLDGLIFAEEKGHIVQEYENPLKAFSVKLTEVCAIAINHKALSPGEETTILFHELGHCETGSFYNQYTPYDIRQKHENRADKWAIKKLVPLDELQAAYTSGHTEIWDLAEIFNVTEDMIRKALCWYINGNLAVDEYF